MGEERDIGVNRTHCFLGPRQKKKKKRKHLREGAEQHNGLHFFLLLLFPPQKTFVYVTSETECKSLANLFFLLQKKKKGACFPVATAETKR